MKVLLVTERFYPLVGGSEKRYLSLAEELVTLGHEVKVLTGQGDITSTRSKMSFHRRENISGIEIIRPFSYTNFNQQGFRDIRNMVRLGRETEKYLQENNDFFDIIEINTFPHLHLAFIKPRDNILLTWHEYWGDHWFNQQLTHKLGFIIELSNRIRFKHHLAVSNHTKSRMPRSSNIPVVPNGVSPQYFSISDLSTDKINLVYVGRLVSQKRVGDRLIPLFKYLQSHFDNIILDIVGIGSELTRIRELASENNQITVHGYLSEDQKEYILSRGNIFITLSTREGSGISALEACAAGLPIITVDGKLNAVADEIVIDGETGRVCTKECIVDCIKVIMREYRVYSDNARRSVQLNTWEKVTKRLLSLYNRIVSQ